MGEGDKIIKDLKENKITIDQKMGESTIRIFRGGAEIDEKDLLEVEELEDFEGNESDFMEEDSEDEENGENEDEEEDGENGENEENEDEYTFKRRKAPKSQPFDENGEENLIFAGGSDDSENELSRVEGTFFE